MPKPWRIIFAGTPAYAVPALEALHALNNVEVVGVLTQKPKPQGRGWVEKPSAIGQYAADHNLLTLTPHSLRQSEVASLLRSTNADVGVVVAYGKIFPETLLELFPYGWVNAHASLLPRWRGASPIQHAILAGDAVTGVTLMRLAAGMDTGPTFARTSIAIHPDDTSVTLAERLARLSAELLSSELLPYLDGKRPLTDQPTLGITTAPLITKGDGLLTTREPAEQLVRRVRAFTPWPGTTMNLFGLQVKILEAMHQQSQTQPGQIVPLPNGFGVGTAKDLFVPLRMQVPGKKPQTAMAFRSGYPKFFQV